MRIQVMLVLIIFVFLVGCSGGGSVVHPGFGQERAICYLVEGSCDGRSVDIVYASETCLRDTVVTEFPWGYRFRGSVPRYVGVVLMTLDCDSMLLTVFVDGVQWKDSHHQHVTGTVR